MADIDAVGRAELGKHQATIEAMFTELNGTSDPALREKRSLVWIDLTARLMAVLEKTAVSRRWWRENESRRDSLFFAAMNQQRLAAHSAGLSQIEQRDIAERSWHAEYMRLFIRARRNLESLLRQTRQSLADESQNATFEQMVKDPAVWADVESVYLPAVAVAFGRTGAFHPYHASLNGMVVTIPLRPDEQGNRLLTSPMMRQLEEIIEAKAPHLLPVVNVIYTAGEDAAQRSV